MQVTSKSLTSLQQVSNKYLTSLWQVSNKFLTSLWQFSKKPSFHFMSLDVNLMASHDIFCHQMASDVILCHLLKSSYVNLCHLVTSPLPLLHLMLHIATHNGYCKTFKLFGLFLSFFLSNARPRGALAPKKKVSPEYQGEVLPGQQWLCPFLITST